MSLDLFMTVRLRTMVISMTSWSISTNGTVHNAPSTLLSGIKSSQDLIHIHDQFERNVARDATSMRQLLSGVCTHFSHRCHA